MRVVPGREMGSWPDGGQAAGTRTSVKATKEDAMASIICGVDGTVAEGAPAEEIPEASPVLASARMERRTEEL